MCSIAINKTLDDTLSDSKLPRKDAATIEKRLIQFAKAANLEQRNGLDDNSGLLRNMPDDLRGIRDVRIGKHRVYYTGFHTECHYNAFYLKAFKKDDVDNESTDRFQDKMRRCLTESTSRELCPPDSKTKT